MLGTALWDFLQVYEGGYCRGTSTFVVVVAGITKKHDHITGFIIMPVLSVSLFLGLHTHNFAAHTTLNEAPFSL